MAQAPKKKLYKSGDYVYVRGWGMAKVTDQENVINADDFKQPRALPTLMNKDPLAAFKAQLPGITGQAANVPPLMAAKPQTPKYIQIVILPEDAVKGRKTFAVTPDDPKLLEPFTQEDLDRAMKEAWTPQDQQFDDLASLEKHVKMLINSDDLADIGSAYSYACGQPGHFMRAAVMQTVKMLICQKGYLDFIEKGQSFGAKEIMRAGKRLQFPNANNRITFLKGQEPTPAEPAPESVETQTPTATEAPVSAISDNAPKSKDERRFDKLDGYFNQIAEGVDDETFFELSYLIAIFNSPQANQIAFHQRYIILHELFGDNKDNRDVLDTVRKLGHSRKARSISPHNYDKAVKDAFKAMANLIDEGEMSLEVNEEAAEHPDAYERLGDRVFARAPG